jgi:hypothetical protein
MRITELRGLATDASWPQAKALRQTFTIICLSKIEASH